ncbi:MAG: glutamine synthetase beta-grasp domain-containing protein [Candidatus Omnitrophica bacterium]|nr:glutamine synthetase beta-grasp domain-containing protein [Candidatus Omnitrophota bacterium]MBU2043992.1 glutamine synthetase beta-grasp domain-containing protein [Candidatus Omnitrophota bacterium]MBU2250982.1 glutamine synthetase beta-grasp domain-containing protein [Candidatus Omnitrophota bacterium]
MEREYLSPSQAAKILGISRQAIIERIKHGTLYAEKVGSRYIIPKAEVAAGEAALQEKDLSKPGALKTSGRKKTSKEILDLVHKHSIRTIQLWFVDILGILKCVSITEGELKAALEHGKGFDGSSVTGFAEAEESDILAFPDPNTFKILPWTKDEPIARLFCDILNPDLSPYPGDPRYVLKRALQRATKLGLNFYVGPEIEYFYFKSDRKPELIDEGSYFELIPNDLANTLRNKTIRALEEMGIVMEASHHEVAPSQHEIDPQYNNALVMADNVVTSKFVIKEIAQQNGVHATFMPKPLFGQNGSGMHVHQSLFKGERNAFYDKKDKHHLSSIAKGFIAGQLKHAREICSLTAQWVNSYKRLVSGYEAPVYASWAQKNRTTLLRVPLYRPGNEKATRVELRCPDPACNPYLAFAVMLAAGLEGVEKNYELPVPVEPNIYHMAMEEREKRGLISLPGNLFEAILETEKSEFVKKTLGEHIFSRFLFNKKKEWEDYRIQITEYEIKKYLPLL